MPDIVSRIRVEAQGVDQAAREIRKLKDAYDQVATSAKNMSPASAGGVDPFTKATAANTGVMAGGQSSADVAERETRNRRYQEQVQDREGSNNSYNRSIRGAPGAVGQFAGAAEAAGSGRGGAALGGGLGMLAGLATGPAGIALMVASAAAMGVQKFAESSFARMENTYGGGIAQRLGATYADTQNYMTELGRTGVPMGMVNALMTSAGASGAQFNAGNVGSFGLMADIAAATGVDPGTLGALLGGTQRAGVTAEYGNVAVGAGTFGRGSLGTFLGELNRTIEDAMTSGIEINQSGFNQRSNLLGALVEFGGLTPTGAVAMNQRIMGQGQQMAQLQSPESIIAFQAMRVPGESISDTQRRMEENPIESNKAIISYLQRSTGGNDDLFRFRVNQQFGGGLTQGQIDAVIATGSMDISTVAGEGFDLQDVSIRGKKRDEAGNLIDIDPARKVMALRQMEALKGVQDAALELTTMFNEFIVNLRGGLTTSATDIGFGGFRKDLYGEAYAEAMTTIEEVNQITVQDVGNLVVEVDQANLTVRELTRLEGWLSDPNFATGHSTVAALRGNKPLQNVIDQIFDIAPLYSGSYRRLEEEGFETFGPGTAGSFRGIFDDILASVTARLPELAEEGLRGREKREERAEAQDVYLPVLSEFLNRNIATGEQLANTIAELVTALGEAGFVFTDSGITIPTREN